MHAVYVAILLIFTEIKFYFGKVKIFTGATSEDVNYVIACGLKVRGGVKSLRDENLAILAVFFWLMQVADHVKPKK